MGGKVDIIKEGMLTSADVFADYVEIGIDSLLDDSIIKEIPVIKTVNSVFKIGKSINTAFFYKKLITFLVNMNDIGIEERERFIERYVKDDKDFSEKLLYVIDKLDENKKSEYLAKIFKCYGKGSIDYSTFRRFCIILTNIYIEDIKFLQNNIDKEFGGVSAIALMNVGLAINNCLANAEEMQTENIYCISKLGERFCNCLSSS